MSPRWDRLSIAKWPPLSHFQRVRIPVRSTAERWQPRLAGARQTLPPPFTKNGGFVDWARASRLLLLLVIAAAPCAAQLTIVNPKQLEVPEEKGNVLLSTACRVVAQEFHVSDPSALRFSLVLVLGEREEHYTVDEKRLAYKLYMKEWDETKFAGLAMRLCIQQLPTHQQEARLLKEILRRSEEISPVPANKLRRDAPVRLPPPPRGTDSDCMSALREQPCRNPNSAPP